jgi:ribosome biogenesis GTPase
MSLSRRTDRLDEDDIRVRAKRGKSRPRSKVRPGHDDAGEGFVVAVDRGRLTCVVGAGRDERRVTAMKARELGRKGVVVGDRVAVVGDLSGEPDTLARIVRVEKRTSVLRRTADDTDPVERVVVANAEQLAIVVAAADPEPRTRLIDRALVAAYDAAMTPLLVVTKTDLADPAPLLDTYRALGVDHVAHRRGDDPAPVLDVLRGRVTVFVGASGVGKSTLVNALVPSAGRAVGHVNVVTGRGRHTSTSAVALELLNPEGIGEGWVVDTPGIRSFGLAHVDLGRVIAAFPDLAGGAAGCPRSCSHDEPECALDAWVADGHAEAARLDSLRRLLSSRDAADNDAGPDRDQSSSPP